MTNAPPRPAWWKSEDWLAVFLGFLVLGLVLAGVRPPAPKYAWADGASLAGGVLAGTNLLAAGGIGVTYLVLSAAGVSILGGDLRRYAAGFPAVFVLAFAAQLAAGCRAVDAWGLEYVLFALALGLLISNTLGTPAWLREAARTEFFIKTGLVIYGSGLLFNVILSKGAPGILQSVFVVTVVWYASFWLCRRLRVDDAFGAMLSTAVSICGVSAAIAACGAIQGDRKKLSYVTSLVLVVAVPMMVAMPWIVKAAGIPPAVAGAWIGGTLDTTGSVTAAAEQVGREATETGVIVKMAQNVLIGVAAFLLSVWWSVRGRAAAGGGSPRPGAAVIWERFPKFVLGFVAASLLFSFVLDRRTVDDTKGILKALTTAWFALAFVSIGLETRFRDLVTMEGGRPAAAFILAQAFNVAWTLGLAYLFFG